MADLPTNLKDDILDSSVNTRRKYRMIENEDGTYSFEDATEYNQVGDEYGAGLINETNRQVNARVEKAVVVRDLETIGAITQEGYIPDALAVKEVSDSLTAEIYDFGTITYQQALDQLLTFENVPLGQTKTFMILSSDCGYQLAKATAFNTDWISGTSTPAVAVGGGGKSYVFSRFISGGASTEIRPFSGGGDYDSAEFTPPIVESVGANSTITKTISTNKTSFDIILIATMYRAARKAGGELNITSGYNTIELLNEYVPTLDNGTIFYKIYHIEKEPTSDLTITYKNTQSDYLGVVISSMIL